MSKKNLESFLLMISHDKKQNSHNKVIVILFSFFKIKYFIVYQNFIQIVISHIG